MIRISTNKFFFSTFILTFISLISNAQCEDITGNNEGMKNWKEKYFEYFQSDSSKPLIKADSVLIYYFSNKENETNYGMPCSFYLGRIYAQKELKHYLNILYSKLEKQDSINFYTAQQAWQFYYNSELEFLSHAFIAYANRSKYGLGRETMIDNEARNYQIIKDRILTVESYIETATSNVDKQDNTK